MPEYKEEIFVRSYDVDFKKELKLFSLFNYMQEVAWVHAEELGFGHEFINNKGMFWVLSRIKVEIESVPKWADNINLTTWPRGADSIFALRDYLFTNNRNETVAKGTSSWLILDQRSLKPQKVSSVLENLYENDKSVLNESLQKIKPEGVKIRSINKTALYSDIDVNNHVNNAIYVSWTSDVFDIEFIRKNRFKSIQLNFVSEAKTGDNIEISLFDRGNNSFYVEGMDVNEDSRIFQALVDCISLE